MDRKRFDRVRALVKTATSERLGKFVGVVEAFEKKGPRQRMHLYGLRNLAWEEAMNHRRGAVAAREYDKGKRKGAKSALAVLRKLTRA